MYLHRDQEFQSPGRYLIHALEVETGLARMFVFFEIATVIPTAIKRITKDSARKLDSYHGIRFEWDWYLISLCHVWKEIRTFSLVSVISVKMLLDKLQIPASFDFL